MVERDKDLLRARRKLQALRRAERRLAHRFDDIDWELDELQPEVKELEAATSQGQLPEFTVEDDR